jgi:hypothetical protein
MDNWIRNEFKKNASLLKVQKNHLRIEFTPLHCKANNV